MANRLRNRWGKRLKPLLERTAEGRRLFRRKIRSGYCLWGAEIAGGPVSYRSVMSDEPPGKKSDPSLNRPFGGAGPGIDLELVPDD